jgi:putative ABC transport system permease protein
MGSAVAALASNKLRSALNMIGIMIGVGAVIVTISLGQGAKADVQARLANLGTNLLSISPGSGNQGGVRAGNGSLPTLTEADAKAILASVSGVSAVSPNLDGNTQVVYNGQNWATQWQGVYPDFLPMQNYTIASGASFTQQDEDTAATVCVVGQTVVDNLFSGQSPIGLTIRIRNVPFTIVGVLTPKGSNGFRDQDDLVLMPFSTAKSRLSNQTWVNDVYVQVADASQMQTVQDDITTLLHQRHKLRTSTDDFRVRNNNQIQQTASATTNTMTYLLAGVAAVSLLVGGIGIMNTMLTSVIERTREIGIRMAIGARRRVILLQFLVEAITLSMVGGFIGAALGMTSARIMTSLAGWTTLVTPTSIMLAVGFSALVGIIFGYYPARSASRLDPIVALRHE